MFDTIALLTPVLIPAFLALDLVHRRRRFEAPRGWRLRGLLVTAATFALSLGITLAWARLFAGRSLLDGSGLGIAGGFAVGVLVYELLHYGYHRAVHRFDPLFRTVHQMHHSAESLDAFGAQYLHPLDTLGFTTLSNLVFFPLLGLRAEAGILAGAFLTFNAMFQHANLATPRWLGYLIQRPESHAVHHARGHHRSNYSDLPLWDIVFGTFENPERFDGECGYYLGASSRIGEMLVGRDVTRPAESALVVAGRCSRGPGTRPEEAA